MGASNDDGPNFIYGNMAGIPASMTGFPVVEYNPDAGPCGEFQGDGILDVRFWFAKDQIQGRTGVAPVHFNMPYLRSVGAIPSALATNNIAAAQGVTNGVAMTLAGASVGVAVNIPIAPMTQIPGIAPNQVAPVTAALALDFGFEFGNCTAGNTTIPVAYAPDFFVGMPVVIGGVGNSAGTAPLLTFVTAINTTLNTITVNNAPVASNATAPIGTGNIWPLSIASYNAANLIPTAALPWLGAGPALLLDPRQSIARGVSITGAAGGTGGTFIVRGWDIYNQAMSCSVVVAAGSNTVYSIKAFKYIASVTPQFTDAGHNYTVGTSDMFGGHYFTSIWDDLDVTWANTFMNSNTGFTGGTTGAASSTTGDVRFTIQVSGNGPLGSGIGTSASNGSISNLAMTGRRLTIEQVIVVNLATQAFPANPVSVFGSQQA